MDDKTRSGAEVKLESEKAEEFKKKISGAHCGKDTKITFETSDLGKVKFAVAGPKCRLKSSEFSISSFFRGWICLGGELG